MVKIINKINLIIEKIGQKNFLLIIFVFLIVLIGGLYGTFSISTTTEGTTIIDGITTYKFILNADESTNSVTIAADSSKYIALTISNPEKVKLKYGIYYSSSDDLTDINIGYLYNSEHKGTDVIEPNKDYIVNIKINNNSSSYITIDFKIAYGLNNNEDLILPDNKTWLEVFSPLATDYIKSLYNDGSAIKTVNIGGDITKPKVSLNPNQNIMLDNNGEYRYYGADPNNYVSYNNELWRIISVSNVKSNITDTTGETRVKIVKATPLEDDLGLNTYSYDSSDFTVNNGNGINDWSTSDLMTELNTLYYNKSSGLCYTGEDEQTEVCDFTNTGLSEEAKNLTDDAIYYLGGIKENRGLYANDYYNLERGTTVYDCSISDESCPRETIWTGRIGIIYPSDYAYATDLSLCTNETYSYDKEICYSKDWLHYTNNNSQWTISPNQINNSGVFNETSGSITNDNLSSSPMIVSPVQYLKANVSITSGQGTINKPYILE